MIIATKRLLIRPFQNSDCSDLYDYLSRDEVVYYEPYQPISYEEAIAETLKRMQNSAFHAVTLNNKVIGNLYLEKGDYDTWEFGYVFHNDYWGMGYAFESAQALIQQAFFQFNARRIIACCNPLNEASWRLLEKLGFRREGTLIKNIYFNTNQQGDPIWQDTYEYGLLKEEWSYD